MKRRELINLGIPSDLVREVLDQVRVAAVEGGYGKRELRAAIQGAIADPADYTEHEYFGPIAAALLREPTFAPFVEREELAPWQQWGSDIEDGAVQQLRDASRLPVAVRGALMPDGHRGYGLPIGGVLATKGAVIPYAVGVDIACRVRLSVLDMPTSALEGQRDRLVKAIERETRFGIGAQFKKPHDHDVLDQDWSVTDLTRQLKPKARKQLGSSGSGNHFVEFGILTLDEPDLGLEAGRYLALLSHSGSRGAGAQVADHYSKLAMSLHPELPRELRHLAWLELGSAAGQAYWAAMELMGDYAAANHEVIHKQLLRAVGAKPLAMVENHHNFAWLEEHDGQEVVVHRKGATPAGEGVLGVIPGSMATPGFVVRGLGNAASLNSSAHGAGRVMSRTKAKKSFTWSAVNKQLSRAGVELISADLDEVPGVYKDIEKVMTAQADLVQTVARFDPKLVKMAPPGHRAED